MCLFSLQQRQYFNILSFATFPDKKIVTGITLFNRGNPYEFNASINF